MPKKRDLLVMVILAVLLITSIYLFTTYYKETFVVGNVKALIDDDRKIIIVNLESGSPSKQVISFRFPFKKNNGIYIQTVSIGSYNFEKQPLVKLEGNKIFDFKKFIYHGKIIIKNVSPDDEKDSIEINKKDTIYDLWVTTGDLPIVCIDSSTEIQNESKSECKITLLSSLNKKAYNTSNISAEIEEADVSKFSPKKSYSINLIEDILTSSVPQILNFQNVKKLKLSSSYFDQSFLRVRLVSDLFKMFQDNHNQDIAPNLEFVEVFVNNNYQGVYLIGERADKDLFNLTNYKKNEKIHSAIHEASNWRADFFKGEEFFKQIEPDYENDGSYLEPIDTLSRLINEQEADFNRDYANILNVNNMVDSHLIFLLSGSNNEIAPTQYIYKSNKDEDKFNFSPGSLYMASFGLNKNYEHSNLWNSFSGNILFNRLYDDKNYRQALKVRWDYLRKDILTYENISNILDVYVTELGDAYLRNYEKWPVEVYENSISSFFPNETAYIKDFVKSRIAWVDSYFKNPLDFKIGNTDALINEENNTIFCSLPQDSEVKQKIYMDFPEDSEVFIEPVSYGKYNIEIPIDNSNIFMEFSEKLKNTPGQRPLEKDEDEAVEDEEKEEKENIVIKINHPRENEVVNDIITIWAWTIDKNIKENPGIESVYVFDGPEKIDQNFIGKAIYGVYRKDVADYFMNPSYANSGFKLNINTFFLKDGKHDLYIYVFDKNNNFSIKILPVTVNNGKTNAIFLNKPEKCQLENGQFYDFKSYIYHGILKVKLPNSENLKKYDLWVTTGDVPVININTTNNSEIHKDYSTDCKIELLSNIDLPAYNTDRIDSTIEIRGNTTTSTPQNYLGFEFTQKEFSSQNEKLLGMAQANNWTLSSCFLDRTKMREKICFDLFNMLRDKEHRDYAPQSRFVEIFINNEYGGLYLLTERIDADMLELNNFNESDEIHSSIFKSFSYATNDTRYWFNNGMPFLKEIEHIGFSQKEPNSSKQNEGILWGSIDTLFEFVIKSPDDYFVKNFDKKFDINNIIDFQLLIEITGSSDGFINNVYFYRDNMADSKFFMAPWDYNLSFGRSFASAQRDYTDWYSRVLFDRLMTIPQYRESLINRWNNLKYDIFSSDNIIQMAQENAVVIDDAQSRNFEKYPIVVGDDWRRSEYPDNYGFYEELNYFKEWIKNRVTFLDDYINYKIDSS